MTAQDTRDGRGLLPDSIRRALLSSMSAVFMTEEGIRSMLTDMRLPKEAMAYLLQQTDRTRREVFRALSQELKGFLKNVDLTQEARKVLSGMRVQIRAEVRFVDDKPEADTKVRVKRKKKAAHESKRRHKESQTVE